MSTILVIGSGGREHALATRLAQERPGRRLLCAPGNPGMAELPGATCLPITVDDTAALVALVRREAVDLVVIGPEAPLAAGLADALREGAPGAAIFGCSARAAEIETSKVFAKGFLQRHGIPTAAHHVVGSPAEAAALLRAPLAAASPWVVKADGLCAGKGVYICESGAEAEAAASAIFARGMRVVIEERLSGREASCLALVDGESVLMLPPCEDHKTLHDGDTGPMTGGMGALCPTPVVTDLAAIRTAVILPAARGMVAEGRPFQGLLFAGLMLTAAGPRVLEFNCRFGDPETQPLLALLADDEDLAALLTAVARGRLAERGAGAVRVRPGAAVCVVLAAAGYPGDPRRGDVITGIADAERLGPVRVFHAGTTRAADGSLRTAGGRVLGVTARGPDLASARELAYRAATCVHFPGALRRLDIGARQT